MAYREIENMTLYFNSKVQAELEKRKYEDLGYDVCNITLTEYGEYMIIIYGKY